MLQWMGGSRRKVTTSRRSTQKRQKQYFEQKKRQQNQSARSEGYADGINMGMQLHREYRSLDILSFLNLSAISKGCGSSCHTGIEDHGPNNSAMKYHIPKGPPTIIPNAVTPAYFVEVKEARTPSTEYQVEIVSPKKIQFSASHKHASSGNNKTSDNGNVATEKELSVFDLLGNDGLDENLGKSPVQEAHVAFSVEGLGRIGTETPVHSPKGLGRISSDYISLEWKDAKRQNLSKNFNHVLGDLELKLDEVMQDIDMSLGHCASDFSLGIRDTCGNKMQKFSYVKDHMQPDDNNSATDRFMDDEYLYISPSDDEFQYERKDLSWKKWQCQIDGSSADFFKYGDNKMSDYFSESSHLLKKRSNAKTRKFHIIESPPKRHTSETGCDFTYSLGDPLLTGKFDFRDVASQPNLVPCVTEDAKDNLSFLREESSSSSAVWGKTTYSPPNLRSRPNIRMSNTFGITRNKFSITRNKFSIDDVFAEETCYKDRNGSDAAVGSGKCARTPVPSKSKPPKHLGSSFQDKIGPSRSWLFEEGCNSVDKSSAFSSFGQTKGIEPTSLGSKIWNEDPLGDFPVPESFVDSKSPFDRGKRDEPIQCSPFSGFTTENSAFCQSFDYRNSLNSPVYSKTRFGPATWDSSPYSATEGTPPDFSHTTGPHGASDLDLSGQGSVSEDENKSELQKANCERFVLGKEVCKGNCGSFSEDSKVVHTLIPKSRDCKSKEVKEGTPALKGSPRAAHSPAHTEETSSSVKIPDKSKNHADENGHNHDVEALLPPQNGNAEKKDAESDRKRILTNRASDGVSSSEPVIMLESYVLQFFCLQKVLEETSALTP